MTRSRLLQLASLSLLLAATPPVFAQAPGTLDPSFGTDGTLTSTAVEGAADMVLDPDDRIVVVGGSGGDFAVVRFAIDGALDPAFGSGGRVRTDLGGFDRAHAVALQPDGKIVAAGSSNGNFAVARYSADGVLDSSFGTGGFVVTDLGTNEAAYAVGLQPSGRIIAAGGPDDMFAPSGGDFLLAAYTPEGTLDPTFGVGGVVSSDFSSRNDLAYDLAIYSDGRIIVVGESRGGHGSGFEFTTGYALARYTADGALDGTFGSGGLVLTNTGKFAGRLNSVALDSAERIVCTGHDVTYIDFSDRRQKFKVERFTPSGAYDPTFAESTFFNFPNESRGFALAIQADGRIVAAGYSLTNFLSARFLSDGGRDTSYGVPNFGWVTYTDFGGEDQAYALGLDSIERIVVAGTSNGRIALARYYSAPPGPPAAAVSPGALDVTLAPGATTTRTLTISNTAGTGAVDLAWSATLTDLAGPSACTDGETVSIPVTGGFPQPSQAGGNEFGQSFTAPCSGTLTSVSPVTAPLQDGFWSGNLRLYDGDGTSGDELAAVPVSGPSQAFIVGSFTATFPTPIAVTEGHVYTWFHDLDAGPSGVLLPFEVSPYPGGIGYQTFNGDPASAVPFGNDPTFFDLPFSATLAPPAWVAISPTSGAVAPGTSQAVEVTFDATGLAEGTYTADLVVATNDPGSPTVTVPVTLVVSDAPPVNFDLVATNTDPAGSPIVVARGGQVTFDYSVANNTQNAVSGDFWFTASRGGITVAQTRILSGSVPAGQTITRTFVQPIPGTAPAGDYTYALKIGNFPNAAVDTETFALTITSAARVGGGESWAVTEAAPWGASSGEGDPAAASSEALPEAFALGAAYPNPFAARATLGVEVPAAAAVRLVVYDALGRTVAVLIDGAVEAGRHEVVFEASGLPSGVYLARLTTEAGFAETQRLVLLR